VTTQHEAAFVRGTVTAGGFTLDYAEAGPAGAADQILKPTQAETFAAYLPAADFRLVPAASHDMQNTSPEQFTALVEKFLAP
jgi:hypothetical protein